MSILLFLEPKKIVGFQRQWFVVLFPTFDYSIRECYNVWKNVNKTKVEVKSGIENFLSKAFQKFHIAIWSCMKFEDVLELFPMLVPKSFLDQFVFIWGHEQCSKTSNEISPESHYYLKDLKHVYYGCHGKDYERRIKHC
jgi:hypothetical protein